MFLYNSGCCYSVFIFNLFLVYSVIKINGAVGEKYFPNGFMFGVATSAYQIEGGQQDSERGQNLWDYHRKVNPQYFKGSTPGDHKFCDAINKWKEDVALLKELGVDFYRFSIDWSRILPTGLPNKINEDGVAYYNNLINALIAEDIKPVVTMYHFDLPQPLQEMGGWTASQISDQFREYAKILFDYFGDRVKHWITLNAACGGYGDLEMAPFLGNSPTAKYLCHHNMILAHAKAYRLYQKNYKNKQRGIVGITIDGRWFIPKSPSLDDRYAAERAIEFTVDQWLHPIFDTFGNYPAKRIRRVEEISKKEGFAKSKLPEFSRDDKDLVQGAYDFLGLNIYTTFLVEDYKFPKNKVSFDKDMGVKFSQDPKWKSSGSPWLKVYPQGLREVLKYIKDKYGNIPICITENGYSDNKEIMEDYDRIEYIRDHLKLLLQAVYEDRVNVKGYTVWSFLDNFEWTSGFSERFGLYHVNFNDPNRTRNPKLSAKWYRQVINKRKLVDIPVKQKVEL